MSSPTLLLHGARDRFVPIPFAEAVAERYPRFELRVFPDLGHVPQLEAPERWLTEVEGWLREVDASRGSTADSVDRSPAAR